MNHPIDIKTKEPFIRKESKFNKFLVLENLENNLLSHWHTWGLFQQKWTNRAYNTFKDLDKYIVIMYLVGKHWQNLSSKFHHLSMEEFYEKKKIEITKINLIQISNDLNIPKETIRRKINELQKQKILVREGKSIIFNKYGIEFQKPYESIELLSTFIEKKSIMLKGNTWFGEELNKKQILTFIKKYFTVVWLRFFKLQIPFLIRHRTTFQDLQTWIVWGNIALAHQYHLQKAQDEKIVKEDINLQNYYKSVTSANLKRGINASSISDISNIPRATVIRKLNYLVKQKLVIKNKKLEYMLLPSPKNIKSFEQNYMHNQKHKAGFVTTIFDLMKNSSFKVE